MSLPTLDIPRYEVELLSKKEKVKFRPFLVKEQKVMMTALQTGEKADATLALMDCVKACTFGEVDVDNLPIFDLERLFLFIRAKSVGEDLPLEIACESCKKSTPYTLKLLDMDIANLDKITDVVMIEENYGLALGYPTAASMGKLIQDARNNEDLIFYINLIKECLLGIVKDGEYYPIEEGTTNEDINKLVDTFTTEQFDKVKAFFDNMPKVAYNIEFDCKECNHHNKIVLEGTDSFFG